MTDKTTQSPDQEAQPHRLREHARRLAPWAASVVVVGAIVYISRSGHAPLQFAGADRLPAPAEPEFGKVTTSL